MDNYNKIKDIFITNECTLLTSFEEFETKRQTARINSYHFVRVDFIGVCGHPSSAVVTNFITRKTGIRCKDCVNKHTRTVHKMSGNMCTTIEYDGYQIVEKYLSKYYEVKRTKEGCKADIAIRKWDEMNNSWIPIQLKVTKQISHKMYSFHHLHNGYNDMLMLCVCIEEEKIWVIPYNILTTSTSLNISNRSKYNTYLVSNNELFHEHIIKYMEDVVTESIEDCMTPTTILQKREQQYVKKREECINFLTYKYPNIQSTAVDFYVNTKKVQEKVGGFVKVKSTLNFYLSVNNGKNNNGIRQFRSYQLGENDYYWFHSSINDLFWIVPEIELYNRGYISNTNTTIHRKILFIPYNERNDYRSMKWIKQYEYNYTNVNKDKIMKLFE
jgi:hypothetical protein